MQLLIANYKTQFILIRACANGSREIDRLVTLRLSRTPNWRLQTKVVGLLRTAILIELAELRIFLNIVRCVPGSILAFILLEESDEAGALTVEPMSV
jgi:hypothetical protein